jgi:hypothetical protein
MPTIINSTTKNTRQANARLYGKFIYSTNLKVFIVYFVGLLFLIACCAIASELEERQGGTTSARDGDTTFVTFPSEGHHSHHHGGHHGGHGDSGGGDC